MFDSDFNEELAYDRHDPKQEGWLEAIIDRLNALDADDLEVLAKLL